MSGDAGSFISLFPKGSIPSILNAVSKAGNSLHKKVDNEHENRVSIRFYYLITRIYPFKSGPLDIRLQPQIIDTSSNNSTLSGQIDFIVSCGLGFETYFAIEAKRLRVRSNNGKMDAGNDDYVNEGMIRFVTGQYAPFMVTGAMLGYVYDGDIKKARSGVAKYIDGKIKELKLMPPKKLTKSSIVTGKVIYETRHDLKKRAFTLYHIFLRV
ncbi:MAG: hypothetical protein ACKVE4_00885 [Dissulfuribacterales bacterium]